MNGKNLRKKVFENVSKGLAGMVLLGLTSCGGSSCGSCGQTGSEPTSKEECYTSITDLETNPKFTTKGNPITISFNKMSNYTNDSLAETAIPTNVSYEIMQGDKSIYSMNFPVSANLNANDYQKVSLLWTPPSKGEYTIKVNGIAESPLCTGKTNLADIMSLGIYVEASSGSVGEPLPSPTPGPTPTPDPVTGGGGQGGGGGPSAGER